MPSLTTYKLLKQEHNARRGEFKTVHGTVQTPAFHECSHGRRYQGRPLRTGSAGDRHAR